MPGLGTKFPSLELKYHERMTIPLARPLVSLERPGRQNYKSYHLVISRPAWESFSSRSVTNKGGC